MGMIDYVYVEGDNKVGIPKLIGGEYYQTTEMDCLSVKYKINENGVFSVVGKGNWEGDYEQDVLGGCLTETIALVGETEEGNKELFLYIENNVVKFVFEYGNIRYRAEDINLDSMYRKFTDEFLGEFEFLLE